MLLVVLSDQLPVKSLGGPLPRQQADRMRAHLQAAGLAVPAFIQNNMRYSDLIKHYLRFHEAVIALEEDYSHVTNPFAAIKSSELPPKIRSLDLHA